MLLPAATFLKLEAMVTARMVGFPLWGSQSPKYSIKPKGKPATSDGRFSKAEISSEEDEEAFGNVVESVPRDSRRRMRRAMMADSWGVGILKPCSEGLGGLEKTCWGRGRLDASEVVRRERRVSGRRMVAMLSMRYSIEKCDWTWRSMDSGS